MYIENLSIFVEHKYMTIYWLILGLEKLPLFIHPEEADVCFCAGMAIRMSGCVVAPRRRYG